MIKFNRFVLDNGLTVIVHEDRTTPLVAMNILYFIGSRDEDPLRTGMAHLFEHLMFCGSVNIPEYDLPLQTAGGDNNAFTNNDITNYYLSIPSENIETGFWLESDRMLEPDFSQKKLDIQKNVVIEEFKQRYLNQPYGDAMLLLRPVVYRLHPYRWPTIGMDISHIQNIQIKHIKEFFFSFYAPNNAIITLAGDIDPDKAHKLACKWFGPVPERNVAERNLPVEPEQTEERKIDVKRDVPADALYKVWHMGSRNSVDYYTLDLLTDLLAGGESGRLYERLVREKKMFSEINAYITSDLDPGLIILSGKLIKGTKILKAEEAVIEVLNELKEVGISDNEMEKVKNKYESSAVLSNTGILNKALNLSIFELLGDPDLINQDVDNYRSVTGGMVRDAAIKYLSSGNCTTMYYRSQGKN